MKAKQLEIGPEVFPNLVLHVLACAGIGFDDEYGEKFRSTLKADEIARVRGMAEAFAAKPPAVSGPLFQMLIQVPCYFPADTPEEISEVYEMVIDAVNRRSFTSFARWYPGEVGLIYKYIPSDLEGSLLVEAGQCAKELEKAIVHFRDILISVYQRFYAGYWPESKDRMEKLAGEVLKIIGGLNLLHEWQNVTCLQFPYPTFHAILGEATLFMGTSLLAEKGIFSAKLPPNAITEMIIHEVGTHIVPLFTDASLRAIMRQDPNGLVRIVEAACQILQEPILEKMGLAQAVNIIAGMGLDAESEVFKMRWNESQNFILALSKAYVDIRQKRANV